MAKSKQNEYDPALVSLFDQPLSAAKRGAKSYPWYGRPTKRSVLEVSGSSGDADSEENGLLSETSTERVHTRTSYPGDSEASIFSNVIAKNPHRKRKRENTEDDIESRHMSKLAVEDGQRNPNGTRTVLDQSIVGDVPQHESIPASNEDLDLEKSSRTVFLANVSTMAIKSRAAKKTLMNHLVSFTSSLPGGHKIESIRFRSTAFAASGIPKKAAFVKREIMDATTKSTNAYVVYSTKVAAREAATRLNGSMVLDRHLRVDWVAHPAEIDHRRCVFVGNLGFVDVDTSTKAAKGGGNDDLPRRAKEPSDVEEGLWRQFEKAGTVESVRVVRDKKTRVGKGFAYIQFKDANSIEKALLYHNKRFPPLLPRILRVTRAKKTQRATDHKERPFSRNAGSSKYGAKVPSQVRSLTGRAHKLLGRVGASRLKERHRSINFHVSSSRLP